jgi:voltage-gated potassium channel
MTSDVSPGPDLYADDQAGRRLVRSAVLIGFVFLVGVVGYAIIAGTDTPVLDAVYMTIITLTTVGYTEVIELTNSPGGKVFTIGLLVLGVGSFLYFFSNLTAFIVEGSFGRLLWRRRMKHRIENLQGHYIVCGGGATGEHVVRELLDTQRPFVLVEADETRVHALYGRLDVEFPVVLGDATDDDNLFAAGIESASGLITCLSDDKDNLVVTVSAKMLRPGLRVVSRCADEKVVKKLHQAGAASVISTNRIGGLRMVSEMVRPTVVTFLDTMLRDREKNLRVEEHTVEAESALADTTVGDLRARDLHDFLVLALRRADDTWLFHPRDDVRLEPGTSLLYMGSPDAREQLARS